MCCNLRTHVIIISIVSFVLTAIASLEIIYTRYLQGSSEVTTDSTFVYWGTLGLSGELKFLFYTIVFVSEAICFMGAFKNNKILLIPFILVMFMQIVEGITFVVHMVYSGTEYDHFCNARPVDGKCFPFFFILLRIREISSFYFIAITKCYYEQLCYNGVTGRSEVVLSPLSTSHRRIPQKQNGITECQQPPPSFDELTIQSYAMMKGRE
jgi:hypothetical protein